MKILITGSSGYLGSFLSKFLSEKNHIVVGIDLFCSWKNPPKNFIFEKCDVRDKKTLSRIFHKYRPSHAIHTAYLMEPQHDKKFEHDVDVNGSINVFLASNETFSVRQLIHFSSASVYGGFPDNPLWIKEKHPLRPRDWLYAQNKKKVEEFCFSYNKRPEMKLVNFRMCTAVGPSYHKKGGVVKAIAKGFIGILLNSKDSIVQLIHEDDIKRIVELAINDRKMEGTFNLAPPSFAKVRQLNPKKLYIPLPKLLFKTIISLLWHLRLISISPTSVDLIANGIVVSPEKLIRHFNYKFLYSTEEAYHDAVKKRMMKKIL